MVVPKTSEISKIYNDDVNKNQAIQQQQQTANQTKIDNNLKQVVSRENVKNDRIKEKQEKNNSRQNEKKKKRQNKDDDRPTIDIRV